MLSREKIPVVKIIQNTLTLNTLRGQICLTLFDRQRSGQCSTQHLSETFRDAACGAFSLVGCAIYTISVKLSDFTVWRHNWRKKNWVNCAVLICNSAVLITVLSSRLSHRELRSSLRESHSFLSLPVFIHHSHTHKKTPRTDKSDGKPCCAREHSVQFFVQFIFYTVKPLSFT